MTRLGSLIAECEICTLHVSKNYNQNEFREDIKIAMKKSGIEGLHSTLIINDNQIIDEVFLEDVNNIQRSGEIPKMWAPDEKEEIQSSVR